MSAEERAAAVAEALKDVMIEHDLTRAEGSYRTGPDSWLTIAVREAGVMDADTADGFVVEENAGSL